MQWSEVLADPSLRNLPYKIELNARGIIEMSPANNRHAQLQGRVLAALLNSLGQPEAGRCFPECAVQTSIGVRVPDVVWCSAEFLRIHLDTSPYPVAPELCIEVLPPSNSRIEIAEKIEAYLHAGAKEVWIVSQNGEVEFHAAEGKLRQSALFPGFHL